MTNLVNLIKGNNRYSLALFVLLFSISNLSAQTKAAETNTIAGNEEIHGAIQFPSGYSPGVPVTVTLQSISQPEIKVQSDRDGEFRFFHLRPDHYRLIVDAGDAFEKATETVSVGFSGSVPAQGNPFSYNTPAVYEVRIYLRPRGLRGDAGAAAELASEKISGPAKKRFREALDEARAGKHSQAIESLKAVIEAEPNFKSAYLELGAEYLKTGEGQRAIDVFKTALKIAPDDSALRLNYGVALLNQKQFADAEAELRLAIEKSKEYSIPAHYYLSVTLLTERKIDEARMGLEDIVKHGGEKLPLVHRYLGGIYLQEKQYGRAADELDKYLQLDPKAADAEKIREMIRDSRSKG